MPNSLKRYTSYALIVTIIYIILVLFVIGDDPIDMSSRFLIAFLWVLSMYATAMIISIND